MTTRTQNIRKEARAMAALALPVVIDQIGMMSMGVADTILVGRLGGDYLGAVGIGASVYYFYMVFAWGVTSAVSPMVAQAFGAGEPEEIERTIAQGFWLGVLLTIGALIVLSQIAPILLALGQQQDLVSLAINYTDALRFGIIASILYGTLRAFTVGLGKTRVTMVISLAAAAQNILIASSLIYGLFGLPKLGIAGAGYATSIAQWCMFLACLYYVLRSRDFQQYNVYRYLWPIDSRRLWRLAKLGIPIGASNSMEQGVFAYTLLLMGQLGRIPLAAHQVAINVAAFTFMTPLGISTAITTRVGQAIGAGQPDAAERAGWVGVVMAGLFMCCTALVFLVIPELIVMIFVNPQTDAPVIPYAAGLLMIAGAFQIFDGIQVAAMGALRGLKDTARPTITNLVAYWAIGLPIGYYLAFSRGMGGHGLWWGLTVGLMIASVLHSLRFRALIGRARRGELATNILPEPSDK